MEQHPSTCHSERSEESKISTSSQAHSHPNIFRFFAPLRMTAKWNLFRPTIVSTI